MADGSEELVTHAVRALLAEIVRQVDDAAASGEVKDLAEALATLAPLVRPQLISPETNTKGGE